MQSFYVVLSIFFLSLFFCWECEDQTTANWSGHRWRCVSRVWVFQASESHASAGPPEVWLSKQNIQHRFFPVSVFSLHLYLLKFQTQYVTQNINALICKTSITKRKCYLLLCHILSVLIFPFDPVTCYFLFKQGFEIECSQTLCADTLHRRWYFVRLQLSPLLIRLFWQLVELTSVKELTSAIVTQFCRVALEL